MSKIAFFCIPAQGHTNPTLEVVKELIHRGHQVRYYSYDDFKEKIESIGAEFISCDSYDMQMKLSPEDGERIAKDLAFSTEIISRKFQPFAETFSEKYTFVGPSIRETGEVPAKTQGKTVYISLGTVNNIKPDFYRNCFEALGDADLLLTKLKH